MLGGAGSALSRPRRPAIMETVATGLWPRDPAVCPNSNHMFRYLPLVCLALMHTLVDTSALLHNVCNVIRWNRRKNVAFDLEFEREYGDCAMDCPGCDRCEKGREQRE